MRADLIVAYRSLTASMTFTGVAVTVLALGIGATTAIYSVVDATLLTPLAFAEPDRLVLLREHRPAEDPANRYPIAPQNFLDWDATQRGFDALAALSTRRLTSTSTNGEVEEATIVEATSDVFDVLRVAVFHGRPFGQADEVPGRHRVAVLSHGYWARTTGGDPAAVGRTLTLEGEPFEIIGVLPPMSYVPGAGAATDAWVAGLFRALGLVIAAVGVYGTLAYGVECRIREIGVRMALGATPTAVVRLVGAETGALLTAGLAAGAVGASWLLAGYQDQWFGVTLADTWSFMTAALVMLVAAVSAAVVPVRRALGVAPAEALRTT